MHISKQFYFETDYLSNDIDDLSLSIITEIRNFMVSLLPQKTHNENYRKLKKSLSPDLFFDGLRLLLGRYDRFIAKFTNLIANKEKAFQDKKVSVDKLDTSFDMKQNLEQLNRTALAARDQEAIEQAKLL